MPNLASCFARKGGKAKLKASTPARSHLEKADAFAVPANTRSNTGDNRLRSGIPNSSTTVHMDKKFSTALRATASTKGENITAASAGKVDQPRSSTSGVTAPAECADTEVWNSSMEQRNSSSKLVRTKSVRGPTPVVGVGSNSCSSNTSEQSISGAAAGSTAMWHDRTTRAGPVATEEAAALERKASQIIERTRSKKLSWACSHEPSPAAEKVLERQPTEQLVRSLDFHVYLWGLNDKGQLLNGCCGSSYSRKNSNVTGSSRGWEAPLSSGPCRVKKLQHKAIAGLSCSSSTTFVWDTHDVVWAGGSAEALGLQSLGIDVAEAGSPISAADGFAHESGASAATQMVVPRATLCEGLCDVKMIAACNTHAVAILENGAAVSFGSNEFGELGQGPAAIQLAVAPRPRLMLLHPAAVAAARTPAVFSSSSCGENFSLLLTAAGAVFACGNDSQGCVGLGGSSSSNDSGSSGGSSGSRNSVSSNSHSSSSSSRTHSGSSSSGGDPHSCSSTSSQSKGYDAAGKGVSKPDPTEGKLSYAWLMQIPTLFAVPVRQVTAGRQHAFALSVSGEVYAWGKNRDGRLGLGSAFDCMRTVNTPTRNEELIRKNLKVKFVAAGPTHSAALLVGGILMLCGSNLYGELGVSPYCLPNEQQHAQQVAKKQEQDLHHAQHVCQQKCVDFREASAAELPPSQVPPAAAPIAVSPDSQLLHAREEKSAGSDAGGAGSAVAAGTAINETRENSSKKRKGLVHLTSSSSFIPLRALAKHRVRHVALGENFSVCTTSKGLLFAWGRNDVQQLGQPVHSPLLLHSPSAVAESSSEDFKSTVNSCAPESMSTQQHPKKSSTTASAQVFAAAGSASSHCPLQNPTRPAPPTAPAPNTSTPTTTTTPSAAAAASASTRSGDSEVVVEGEAVWRAETSKLEAPQKAHQEEEQKRDSEAGDCEEGDEKTERLLPPSLPYSFEPMHLFGSAWGGGDESDQRNSPHREERATTNSLFFYYVACGDFHCGAAAVPRAAAEAASAAVNNNSSSSSLRMWAGELQPFFKSVLCRSQSFVGMQSATAAATGETSLFSRESSVLGGVSGVAGGESGPESNCLSMSSRLSSRSSWSRSNSSSSSNDCAYSRAAVANFPEGSNLFGTSPLPSSSSAGPSRSVLLGSQRFSSKDNVSSRNSSRGAVDRAGMFSSSGKNIGVLQGGAASVREQLSRLDSQQQQQKERAESSSALVGVSAAEMLRLIEGANSTGDNSLLLSKISAVFSDVYRLNTSFVHTGRGCYPDFCGLDEVYVHLPAAALPTLAASLLTALSTCSKFAQYIKSADAARFLIFALACFPLYTGAGLTEDDLDEPEFRSSAISSSAVNDDSVFSSNNKEVESTSSSPTSTRTTRGATSSHERVDSTSSSSSSISAGVDDTSRRRGSDNGSSTEKADVEDVGTGSSSEVAFHESVSLDRGSGMNVGDSTDLSPTEEGESTGEEQTKQKRDEASGGGESPPQRRSSSSCPTSAAAAPSSQQLPSSSTVHQQQDGDSRNQQSSTETNSTATTSSSGSCFIPGETVFTALVHLIFRLPPEGKEVLVRLAGETPDNLFEKRLVRATKWFIVLTLKRSGSSYKNVDRLWQAVALLQLLFIANTRSTRNHLSLCTAAPVVVADSVSSPPQKKNPKKQEQQLLKIEQLKIPTEKFHIAALSHLVDPIREVTIFSDLLLRGGGREAVSVSHPHQSTTTNRNATINRNNNSTPNNSSSNSSTNDNNSSSSSSTTTTTTTTGTRTSSSSTSAGSSGSAHSSQRPDGDGGRNGGSGLSSAELNGLFEQEMESTAAAEARRAAAAAAFDVRRDVIESTELQTRWCLFMAHMNLCPLKFKRNVILVYNVYQQQHCGLQSLLESRLPFLLLRVHRGGSLLDDAVKALSGAKNARDLLRPLKVVFEGEEGVDEGGLKREFFSLLTKELLSPERGLFQYNEETRTYWFAKWPQKAERKQTDKENISLEETKQEASAVAQTQENASEKGETEQKLAEDMQQISKDNSKHEPQQQEAEHPESRRHLCDMDGVEGTGEELVVQLGERSSERKRNAAEKGEKTKDVEHSRDALRYYWLTGILASMAVYNDMVMPLALPVILYNRIQGQKTVSLEDLSECFPEQQQSFEAMLAMNDPAEFEAAFGEQKFAIDRVEEDGSVTVVPLIEEGEQIAITMKNRYLFVLLYTRYLLVDSIKHQFEAFARGMRLCCSPLVAQLSGQELQLLVCGIPELNFQDLRKHCKYEGFEAHDPYIESFWDVVFSYDLFQKKKFLKFVTGSDRAPAFGLQDINLVVQKNGTEPTDRLPTAYTCFNVLLLPQYCSTEKLRLLLGRALDESEGFGLQ